MRYKVWERILNEVVDGPDFVQLGEVEAESFVEALKIARISYPNKPSLKIDDLKTSIEYDMSYDPQVNDPNYHLKVN